MRYLPLFISVVEDVVNVSHGPFLIELLKVDSPYWRKYVEVGNRQTEKIFHPRLPMVCKIPATVCKGYEATLSSASPGVCFDGNLLRAIGETPEYFKRAKVFPLQLRRRVRPSDMTNWLFEVPS